MRGRPFRVSGGGPARPIFPCPRPPASSSAAARRSPSPSIHRPVRGRSAVQARGRDRSAPPRSAVLRGSPRGASQRARHRGGAPGTGPSPVVRPAGAVRVLPAHHLRHAARLGPRADPPGDRRRPADPARHRRRRRPCRADRPARLAAGPGTGPANERPSAGLRRGRAHRRPARPRARRRSNAVPDRGGRSPASGRPAAPPRAGIGPWAGRGGCGRGDPGAGGAPGAGRPLRRAAASATIQA